jgi:type I thyroxine 5'-deiodinase
MFNTYCDRAEFFLVYIREAHPDSILYTKVDGAEVLKKIGQTAGGDDRKENAKLCAATLKLSMPTLIDGEDNRVNRSYGAWPDRLYVIGIDGKVAYQGAPGPKGFRPGEVVEWLKKNANAVPAQ